MFVPLGRLARTSLGSFCTPKNKNKIMLTLDYLIIITFDDSNIQKNQQEPGQKAKTFIPLDMLLASDPFKALVKYII